MARISKRWVNLASRLAREGAYLVQTRARDPREVWSVEPGGKRAPRATVEKAIKRGDLIPNEDGLFGTSQTWRLTNG